MAARDRDLPERVIEWYEDWIFLFVAWCLAAPPHCVHRDRINDFWWALTDHPGASRWKVCQAMDALGMLFGALGGTDILSFPEAPATETDDAALEDGLEQPSRYLPDGRLPEDVDPRAEVPTREARSGSDDEPETPATEEAGPSPSDTSPDRDDRTSPKTLFNPTGTAPPPDESSRDERGETAEEKAADAADTVRTEELVSVDVPRPAAKRLRAASRALDLPEPLLVARAIDLLRDKVGDLEGEDDENSPLRRYQAQVNLLHRHGTADLPSPGTNNRGGEAEGPSERGRRDTLEASVCVGTTRGDGWAGEVPVLEIRSD